MKTSAFVLSFALLFALTRAESMPEPQCWTETKKCRYVAVASGYECKDYYADKYARCHPKMKYKKQCDKAVYSPTVRPEKPSDYVNWEQTESTLVSYDENYGPHVQGYPHTETSDYYYTKKLPSKPYGVTEDPFPPPTGNVAPGEPNYVVPPKTGTQKPAYTSPPAYTTAPTPKTSSNSPPAYTAPPATSSTKPPKHIDPRKATKAPAYTAPPYAPASTPPPMTSGAQPPQNSY